MFLKRENKKASKGIKESPLGGFILDTLENSVSSPTPKGKRLGWKVNYGPMTW